MPYRADMALIQWFQAFQAIIRSSYIYGYILPYYFRNSFCAVTCPLLYASSVFYFIIYYLYLQAAVVICFKYIISVPVHCFMPPSAVTVLIWWRMLWYWKSMKPLKFQRKSEAEIFDLSDFLCLKVLWYLVIFTVLRTRTAFGDERKVKIRSMAAGMHFAAYTPDHL